MSKSECFLPTLIITLATLVVCQWAAPADAQITQSNLVFHLDAQDVNGDGIANNPGAGALSNWLDTTSNNIDFSSTGGDPTYNVGTGPNSTNFVGFTSSANGSDRMIMDTAMSNTTLAGPGGNTVNTFMVMKLNSNGVYFQYDNGRRHSAENAERWDFGGLNNTLTGWSGSNTLQDGSWHILELAYDGSEFDIYVDGVNELNFADATRSLLAGTSQMGLGGRNDGNNNVQSLVDYAEFAHYNVALTEDERNATGAFLADKYGLDTAYVAPAVPEPASVAIWSLLSLGLAGFGFYRLRKQK